MSNSPRYKSIATQLAAVATLCLLGSSVAIAAAPSGDAALFSASGGAPPNILLLLDSSGSMGKAPANCSGCDIKRNMASRAIQSLVEAVNPDDGNGGNINNARLGFAIFTKAGARLLVPIGDNTVRSIVNWVSSPDIATAANNLKAIGGNSHGLAMMEMGRYFAHDQATGGAWGSLPPWGFADPAFTGTYTGSADKTDFQFEDPTLPSPWDLACRPSFLIHIDDGLWGGNEGDRFGKCGSVSCPRDFIGDRSGNGEFWMEDISQALFESDFSDENNGGFKGKQNVVTYVIGFDEPLAVDLMRITAEVGGGSFFFATSESELEEALFNITVTIFESVASFAGVAVPSSRSSSGASLYNAYFEPRNNQSIWAGHLEAYGLDTDGTILDKFGDPATDPATGLLIEPHLPYWDAGTELLTKSDRKLYTIDTSGSPIVIDERDPGSNTGSINVTIADLNLNTTGGTGGSGGGGTGGGAGGSGGTGGGGGSGGTGGTGGATGACGAYAVDNIPVGWDFQILQPTVPRDIQPDGIVKVKYCVDPSRSGIDKDSIGTYPITGTGTDAIEPKNRKKNDGICTYLNDDGINVTGGWKQQDLKAGKHEGMIEVRYYISKKDKKGKAQNDSSPAALKATTASICVTNSASAPSGTGGGAGGGSGTGGTVTTVNPDFAPFPNASTSGIDTYDELLESVVNFLYGRDGFNDDPTKREDIRGTVLGDIFHSTPLVIGQPSRQWAGNAPFDAFARTFADRDRIIYAGANDGILHAFHAGDWTGDDTGTPNVNEGDDPNTPEIEYGYYDQGTGEEVFGYVPRLLLPKVKELSHNIPRSTYFVDAPPTAADAYIDVDGNGTPEWTTVLMSGLREGGAGYMALDITDPSATPPGGTGTRHFPDVIWEFSHAKLGQSWSEATIARVKVRGPVGSGDLCGYPDGDGDCEEKFVVIFGGGYDPAGDPNRFSYVADPTDPLWVAESKAIFIVDLESGNVLQMLAYDRADTSNLSRMNFSFPSRPAVIDSDFDGFTDVIYIGDLGGQMWKWDISAVGEDTGSDGVFDNWYSGVFFHATPAALSGTAKHYRSFFSPPGATFLKGKLYLAFGSGEREELRYEGTSYDDENRFYVVIDDTTGGSDPLLETRFTSMSTSAVMTEEDIIGSDITDLGTDPLLYPIDYGFFYKAEEGEKFITDVAIFAGHVIVASYSPTSGADLCTTAGGVAYLHAFDVGTGKGAFGDPDTDDDPVNDRRFVIGGGLPSNPKVSMAPDPDDDAIYIKTSTGQIIVIDDAVRREKEPATVIYWRQKY